MSEERTERMAREIAYKERLVADLRRCSPVPYQARVIEAKIERMKKGEL